MVEVWTEIYYLMYQTLFFPKKKNSSLAMWD